MRLFRQFFSLVKHFSDRKKMFYTLVLRTKTNRIYHYSHQTSYDFIAITETWLYDGIYSAELSNSNYNMHTEDRNQVTTDQDRGCGILLMVLSDHYSGRIYFRRYNGFGLGLRVGKGYTVHIAYYNHFRTRHK